MRLLVVEDEIYLLDVLKKRLTKEHYSVDACEDGLEAWDFIKLTPYDGIILDIMLPGMDGIEILKRMRKEGNHTPVLLLTARDSIEDRVTGLDIGADDYLVKPFAFEELLARIRAVLRRTGEKKGEVHEYGGIQVYPDSRRVTVNGSEVSLTSKEFDLLTALISQPEKVCTRSQLLSTVWGYISDGESRTVDVHVKRLRDKLVGCEKYGWRIQTIWGRGYKFEVIK